jgi:hypothetical protein
MECYFESIGMSVGTWLLTSEGIIAYSYLIMQLHTSLTMSFTYTYDNRDTEMEILTLPTANHVLHTFAEKWFTFLWPQRH